MARTAPSRASRSARSVTPWSWYRSNESHRSRVRESSSWARTPSGLWRKVLQATNSRSRTAGISGPRSSWARPYWGATSRWLTPASSASWKEAAVVSGSERAKAAPPRTATDESCPVRPSLRRSTRPTVVRRRQRNRVGQAQTEPAGSGADRGIACRLPALDHGAEVHRVVDVFLRGPQSPAGVLQDGDVVLLVHGAVPGVAHPVPHLADYPPLVLIDRVPLDGEVRHVAARVLRERLFDLGSGPLSHVEPSPGPVGHAHSMRRRRTPVNDRPGRSMGLTPQEGRLP